MAAPCDGLKPKKESPGKRRLIRLGVGFFFSGVVLSSALVWWCASEIAAPPRRPVQAFALPYLNGSVEAGFEVEHFTSSGGMPCLVCLPKAGDSLSERARIIRDQLTARGVALRPPGASIGTLLILHGRSGMKEDYLPVAERFCAAGFVCVIPDLPGHGSHPERYTTYGVLEAPKILQCFNEAVEELELPVSYRAVLGQSMGGSEAVHLAAREDSEFRSMILLATFDELERVIHGQTSGLLGSVLGAAVTAQADVVYGWKTGLKFSEIKPVEKAPLITARTLVIHGDRDRTIPASAGRSLYEALPDAVGKEWLLIPDAGHDDIFITDFPLYATMAEWLLRDVTPP